ncbi:response regulator [Ningiella sp. W23]|uniref:response regulator n=1 Tax=Ningiella sp. W23 TaxID=3023715 RepID=UPI0037582183
MKKLILLDDDVGLSELLSDYLSSQGFDIQVYNDPQLGLNALKQKQFDLLLLDVMMPSIDGFELLRQLRQFSSIPVIMLTAKGDDYDKILGLELGADDYLPKPFNHRELLARIKALLRRLDSLNGFSASMTFNLHGISIEEASQSVHIGQHEVLLTGTEYLMLLHLVKHGGSLVSKEQLSEQVLGRRLAPYDRSLDMHMSNIRKKLAAYDVHDVIKTVRGSGYMMKAAQ